LDALNNEFLTVNWDEEVLNKDMDELTDAFIKVIEDKVKIVMRNKSMEKTTHDKNGQIFTSKNLIPKHIRKLFKKKCKLSKQLRSVTTLDRCLQIRDNIKNIDFQIQSSYEYRQKLNKQKTFEKSKNYKYYLYQYIKRINRSKSTIGPFLNKGKIIDEKPCNSLKSQYKKVFTNPLHNYKIYDSKTFFTPVDFCLDCDNERVHICPLDYPTDLSINRWDVNDIYINPIIIKKILQKLEPTAACGPEGIPAILLKYCARTLYIPITKLWQKSYDLGYDPIPLKGAYIHPNLKEGGNRTDPAAWRPLSHTSQLSLVFERYIKEILVNHLELHGLLGNHQHGFRKNRSCISQLLIFYEKILQDIEEGHNNDVIFLDFAKAFDKVDIGLLCHSLKQKRIWGKMGVWLESFLTNRTQ